jgi:PAS domain S-box-containing protein
MTNLLSNPVYLIPPVVAAAIGLFLLILVLRKARKSPANRLFSFVLLSLALWSIFIFFMRASPDVEHALYWDRLVIPAGFAMFLFYYHFTCVYTDRINSKLIWTTYSLLIAISVLSALGLVVSHMTLESYGYAPHFYPTMYVIGAGGFFLLISGLVNLAKARGSATRYEEKTRLTYMLIAIVFPFIAGLMDLFPNLPPVSILGNVVLGIVTTIAILKYHLLDIRLVVRKGLAYLLMSATVASIYVGLLALLNHLLGVAHVPAWGYVALLVLLALVLLPLWRRLQRVVDRWFYRERYDFLKELEQFSQEAHDITDIGDLGSSLVKLIGRAFQASTIRLMLPSQSGDFEVIASTGQNSGQFILKSQSPLLRWLQSHRGLLHYRDLDIVPRLQSLTREERDALDAIGVELLVPLTSKKNELVGLLLLGSKLSQQDYSPEDERFILSIADRVTVELENARLYEEARRSEQAMRVSERKYRERIENLLDAVVEVNLERKFIYASPRVFELFGFQPEELIGKNIAELIHPDDLQSAIEAMREARSGSIFRFEFKTRHKGGHYVIVSASGRWVKEGDDFKLVGVLRDITDRKQMEAQRRELEQKAQLSSRLASIGEMASGIAHEINNPLTAVIGFAELLRQKDLPSGIKNYVETIHQGAQRVASIVSRLLAFARQDRPERHSVNINDVLETTLALRAYEMKTNNIKVTTQFARDLPRTMANAGQLQQVFLNIIINAETEMKLAHGMGNLLIKTEMIDGAIRISFKDDGPGIAKENMNKIFDPFFTTREVGKGTGLGLSLCHGIVTDHHGQIYAKSEPGKGATFVVELPTVREELLEPAELMAEKPKKTTGARILVVDDEPAVLQFLCEKLTGAGHKVETVDNASDALERIKSERYSLILLDIKLPGMSGIELYRRIQEIAKSLAGRVIFITGDVMGVDTSRFLSKAKAHYVTKPFDTEQLNKEIDSILD